MKVRTGFVSNSSSSSFICDTELSAKEVEVQLREMLEAFGTLMGEEYNYDEVFSPVEQGVERYSDFYNRDMKVTDVIIDSRSDNTLPSGMWDFIEERFNATRYMNN